MLSYYRSKNKVNLWSAKGREMKGILRSKIFGLWRKKRTYKEKRGNIGRGKRRRMKEKKSGKYLEREELFLKDQIVPLFKYFPIFLIQSPFSPEREWEWRNKSFKYLERGTVWSWRRMKEEKGKYFEKEIIALSGKRKMKTKMIIKYECN